MDLGAAICTPSRAALQTGRYALRTGCTGVEEAHRVIPTPANPGGLDPTEHLSLATALSRRGYNTAMAGKCARYARGASMAVPFAPSPSPSHIVPTLTFTPTQGIWASTVTSRTVIFRRSLMVMALTSGAMDERADV